MAFVHGFMCQHGLTNQITNRKNIRDIGTHLTIDFDKAAIAHQHTGFVSTDFFTIRCAAHRLQHQIVTLRLFGCPSTFKGDVNTVFFSNCTNGFCIEHQIIKAMGVFLLPYFD